MFALTRLRTAVPARLSLRLSVQLPFSASFLLLSPSLPSPSPRASVYSSPSSSPFPPRSSSPPRRREAVRHVSSLPSPASRAGLELVPGYQGYLHRYCPTSPLKPTPKAKKSDASQSEPAAAVADTIVADGIHFKFSSTGISIVGMHKARKWAEVAVPSKRKSNISGNWAGKSPSQLLAGSLPTQSAHASLIRPFGAATFAVVSRTSGSRSTKQPKIPKSALKCGQKK
ncbi:hypothetical protein DFH06DRAFT_1299580 [Mycena polygramma]|nr:hypothetical protein DFH06DRAFT_1299580 [Mycena polygramma]